MDIYCPRDEVRFLDWNYSGHTIKAPHFLVEKHIRFNWELEQISSMEANLTPNDILIDVGAEQGQQAVPYARFVGGGHHMVLMEPVPQVWPNIKATWEANNLKTPLATYCGFVGEYNFIAEQHDFEVGYKDGWPLCAYSEYLLDSTKFRYLTEHSHVTDCITIDSFIKEKNIKPTAISMDVEGFEIKVLKGAIETLKNNNLKVWVSLHTVCADILARDEPGVDHIKAVHDLMNDLGYKGEFLSRDHEEHWFFSK